MVSFSQLLRPSGSEGGVRPERGTAVPHQRDCARGLGVAGEHIAYCVYPLPFRLLPICEVNHVCSTRLLLFVPQEPENIDEVLVSLSSLELHLFISVLNVYGRSQQGGAGSSAGSALSTTVGISSSSRPLVMLVDKVLAVCDMLVEVLKQKVRNLDCFLDNW